MKWAEDNVIDGKKTLIEITDSIMNYINKNGIIKISSTRNGSGRMAMPRRQEIMSAFNRYRGLKL